MPQEFRNEGIWPNVPVLLEMKRSRRIVAMIAGSTFLTRDGKTPPKVGLAGNVGDNNGEPIFMFVMRFSVSDFIKKRVKETQRARKIWAPIDAAR